MATMHELIITGIFSTSLGWLAAQGAAGFLAPAAGKEPRFAQLTLAQLDDKQRPLGEAIMKISSVGIAGPYNPMLRRKQIHAWRRRGHMITAGVKTVGCPIT